MTGDLFLLSERQTARIYALSMLEPARNLHLCRRRPGGRRVASRPDHGRGGLRRNRRQRRQPDHDQRIAKTDRSRP